MAEKYNSFNDLLKIKDKFESESEINETPIEINTSNVEIQKESEVEITNNRNEKSPKLVIGDEILSSSNEGEPIASWRNSNGDLYSKVSSDYYVNRKDWTAVTNPGYRGRGLIVFIDKKPQKGDKIKITQVFEKSAKGVII